MTTTTAIVADAPALPSRSGLAPATERVEAPHDALHYVWPLLRRQHQRLLELGAYIVLNLTYAVTLPLAGKYLVDNVVPAGSVGALAVFCGVLFGIYVLNAVVGVRRAYVTELITQRVAMGLAQSVFSHLQQLPLAFYSGQKQGDLAARLSGDLFMVEQALGRGVGVALFLALTAVVSAAAAIALNPLLGLLLLLIVPVFGFTHAALQSRLQTQSYQLQAASGMVAATVQENLAAHAEVQAFGLEQWALADYQSRLASLARVTLRLVVTGALFETSMILATTLGQLLVLGAGGYLIMAGQLSVGSLLAFVGLLAALFQPVAALSDIVQTAHKASGALLRINEILDEPLPIADRPGARSLPPVQREIGFEHVSFGYRPDKLVLRDVNLRIPAGGRVAIVGASGSGKSSLIRLLIRFSDPTSGAITFDGHDAREIRLASLRSQVGVVLQDTFLFDGTVRENIAIGLPAVPPEAVAAAAAAACLHDEIQALPHGYDTQLGERGLSLSGGQRQRLALARALVREPRILVLDEATSALDLATEHDIVERLQHAGPGQTVIMVTHRLNLAVTADWIVVLDDGRVAQQGRHADLVGAPGVYQRLWQAGAHE
jgi:ABC-type bacteriocin/lantibiotic exporter with double-glycine peptidase domain